MMFPRIGAYAQFGQPYDARLPDATQIGSPYDMKMPDTTQIGAPYDAMQPPLQPGATHGWMQPLQPAPWSGTAQISPPSMMGPNPDLMYTQQQQQGSYPFNRLYGAPVQPNYGYSGANPYAGLARLMQGYGNPRVRSF